MMSFFRKPEVANLSEWLEIATRKLVEPSRERIRREVEAHYAEAVEGHCETGLSESAAKAEALAELGDPKAAGRRFRREHFTEREYRELKQSQKAKRALLFLSYCLFGLVVFDSYHPNGPLYLGLQFLLLVVVPTASCVLAERAKAINRHLVLVDAFGSFCVGFLLRILLEKRASIDWTMLIFGVAIIARFASLLRIWIKLGRVELRPDEAAPPNSVET